MTKLTSPMVQYLQQVPTYFPLWPLQSPWLIYLYHHRQRNSYNFVDSALPAHRQFHVFGEPVERTENRRISISSLHDPVVPVEQPWNATHATSIGRQTSADNFRDERQWSGTFIGQRASLPFESESNSLLPLLSERPELFKSLPDMELTNSPTQGIMELSQSEAPLDLGDPNIPLASAEPSKERSEERLTADETIISKNAASSIAVPQSLPKGKSRKGKPKTEVIPPAEEVPIESALSDESPFAMEEDENLSTPVSRAAPWAHDQVAEKSLNLRLAPSLKEIQENQTKNSEARRVASIAERKAREKVAILMREQERLPVAEHLGR